MSLIVRSTGKSFPIASEGTHVALLGAICDVGEVETAFGVKDKLKFVWVVDESDDEGNPLLVFQSLTKSTHPKSTLAKTIKGMTGKEPGEGFDVMQLLGSAATLVLEHNESEGKRYANVVTVLKAPKDSTVTLPEDWQPPKFKSGTVYTVSAVTPDAVVPF